MAQDEKKKKRLITLGVLTVIAIGSISFFYYISTAPSNKAKSYEVCKGYYDTKDYDECIKCFNSYEVALREKGKPLNYQVYKYRGQSYYRTKKYQEAVKDFTAYLKKNEYSHTMLFDRARAYEKLGNMAKAKADIEKSCKFGYEKACNYRLGGGGAVVAGGGSVGKERTASDWISLGNQSMKTGKYGSATEFFTKAIEIDPKMKDAYLFRGLSYRQQRNFKKALDDYNKLLDIDPNYAKAYNNRGVVYWRQKDYTKALSDYNKTIKLKPKDYIAYNNRAVIFYEMGRHEEAIKDYDNAIRLNPDFAESYWNRAVNYMKLNKKEEAKKDFQKACDLKMKNACEEANKL